MFEKVKTLHFESEAFQTPSNYDIFLGSNRHTCLIYGRNGAGKSTLAKAFRNLKDNTTDGITSSSFIDQAGNPVLLSEEERKSIYVFDEDYINQKIKIKGDKLESIIMLGEQVDIDNEIRELEAELTNAEETLSQAIAEYSRFTDSESTDNPNFYMANAKKLLKQRWAPKRKEIWNLSWIPNVKEEKVSQLAASVPKSQEEQTRKEYDEKYNLLNSLRRNECHPLPVPVLSIPSVDEEHIIALLSKKVEKPELSERDNRLVQLIFSETTERIKKTKEVFLKPEVSECPFCYQPVTPDYKAHLLEIIKAKLNKDVEEHIRELESAVMQPLDIDFSVYYAADKALCDECKSQLFSLNDRIAFCNENLKAKINETSVPIILSDIGLDNAYLLLIASIRALKDKVDKYNQSIDKETEIQNQLSNLNDAIAFYEIRQDFALYLKKKSNMEAVNKKVKGAEKEIDRIRHEIETLGHLKEQITIAVDIINSHLR